MVRVTYPYKSTTLHSTSPRVPSTTVHNRPRGTNFENKHLFTWPVGAYTVLVGTTKNYCSDGEL